MSDTLSDCCKGDVWFKELGARFICAECLKYCHPIAQKEFKAGEGIWFKMMPTKIKSDGV